jgi:ubiquinone biosynthesis protein UbiJ
MLNARDVFTCLAMIDKVKHDNEVLRQRVDILTERLSKDGALSPKSLQRMDKVLDTAEQSSHRDQLAEQVSEEVGNVKLPEALAKQVDDVIGQQGAITQPETVADCLETSFGELLERANQWRRDEGNDSGKGAILPKS